MEREATTRIFLTFQKIILVESPDINPCIYNQLLYDKGAKNIQGRKDGLFSKCWENCTVTYKRMKLDHYLTLYTKTDSRWIKDLNIRPGSIKLLKENMGSDY